MIIFPSIGFSALLNLFFLMSPFIQLRLIRLLIYRFKPSCAEDAQEGHWNKGNRHHQCNDFSIKKVSDQKKDVHGDDREQVNEGPQPHPLPAFWRKA